VFDIEIFNQSAFPVYEVVLNDYISADMNYVSPSAYNDGVWDGTNGDTNTTVTTTIASIAPYSSTTLQIELQIDPSFQGTEIINYAEIIAADDDQDTDNASIVDQDSPLATVSGSPDSGLEINTDGEHDDEATDPDTTDGTDVTPGTADDPDDEDDHDPAKVMIGHVYDVALIKTLDNDT